MGMKGQSKANKVTFGKRKVGKAVKRKRKRDNK